MTNPTTHEPDRVKPAWNVHLECVAPEGTDPDNAPIVAVTVNGDTEQEAIAAATAVAEFNGYRLTGNVRQVGPAAAAMPAPPETGRTTTAAYGEAIDWALEPNDPNAHGRRLAALFGAACAILTADQIDQARACATLSVVLVERGQ
jgi:hypothetical protein